MLRLALLVFFACSHVNALNAAKFFRSWPKRARLCTSVNKKIFFQPQRFFMRFVVVGGVVGGASWMYFRPNITDQNLNTDSDASLDALGEVEHALINGNTQGAIEHLINSPRDVIFKKTSNEEHPTLLDLALHLKNYEVAEELLIRGANPNTMSVLYRDSYLQTAYAGGFEVPLICRYVGDHQALTLLRKYNADINTTDSRGHSLLYYYLTSYKPDYEKTRLTMEDLYDHGLKVSSADRPIFIAEQQNIERNGWWRFLEDLDIPVQNNVKMRHKLDFYRALFYGDLESAQEVYNKNKFNLNEPIDCFTMPGSWLNDAVISGDIKKVQFLLDNFAHPNIKIANLPKAGELAQELGHIEIATLLLSHMEYNDR